jgi:predicted 3-demethylubiquinone-9 3-methyltransferase (glyoxalase superfamily)
MTTIAPCLWFDGKAEEAARFYVSLLPNSHIDSVVPYYFEAPGGKPGDVMMSSLRLRDSAIWRSTAVPPFSSLRPCPCV